MLNTIACIVLFLSMGKTPTPDVLFFYVVILMDLFITYFPSLIHKPQLVDVACRDIIIIFTHVVCLFAVQAHKQFYYACCVHTLCFLVQNLIDRDKKHKMLLTLSTLSCLTYLFFYSESIQSIHVFVFSALWPHAIHMLGYTLWRLHDMFVCYVKDT
jgi:hypothetical protein